MWMSAFCRRKQGGFTLLELLVVMAIVSLLAALVAPGLQRVVGSMERAADRDGLVADIAGLSYRAYALGQSFELSNKGMQRLLSDGNPVLAVPSGWRVDVTTPIGFGFNGWCSGGELRLTSPDLAVETLRLTAPHCQLERE